MDDDLSAIRINSGYPILSYPKNHRRCYYYDRQTREKSVLCGIVKTRSSSITITFPRCLCNSFFRVFCPCLEFTRIPGILRRIIHSRYISDVLSPSLTRNWKCGCPSSCFVDSWLFGFVPTRMCNWKFLKGSWRDWKPKLFCTTSRIIVLRVFPMRNRMLEHRSFR